MDMTLYRWFVKKNKLFFLLFHNFGYPCTFNIDIVKFKSFKNMKKLVITFAVLIAVVFTSNAQVFVGGGLSVDYMSGKSKYGSTTNDSGSGFIFNFTPKVGYYMSDKFGFGLQVGFLNGTLKEPSYGSSSQDDKYTLTGWSVEPFVLYKLVEVDKITFLLAGSAGISEAKTKETYGSTTWEGDPTTILSAGVLPILSYSLTDRLGIDVTCNFLRLGFDSYTTKSADNKDNKDTVNTFGFGVNSPNIKVDGYGDVSFSDYLNVAIIYKF